MQHNYEDITLWKFNVHVTFSSGSNCKYCISPNSKHVKRVSITWQDQNTAKYLTTEYVKGKSTFPSLLTANFRRQYDFAWCCVCGKMSINEL